MFKVPEGAKAVYRHYRYRRSKHGYPTLEAYHRSRKGLRKPFDPLPYGGMTICALVIEGRLYLGKALCSLDDNFCFKRGAVNARDDALIQYFAHNLVRKVKEEFSLPDSDK